MYKVYEYRHDIMILRIPREFKVYSVNSKSQLWVLIGSESPVVMYI